MMKEFEDLGMGHLTFKAMGQYGNLITKFISSAKLF